jgi:diaminopimelate decarboxylase
MDDASQVHARFAAFRDVNGEELATPCYVYDVNRMRQSFSDLRELLGTPLLIRYVVQPNLDVLSRLNDLLDAGLLVSSVWELQQLAKGFGAVKKIACNPAMSSQLIAAAAASRALCVIDNLEQLRTYCDTRHTSRSPIVSLRLQTSEHATTGANLPGMPLRQLPDACRIATSDGIGIHGLMILSGDEDFARGGTASLDLVDRAAHMLRHEMSVDLQSVVLGWELETSALIEADLSRYASRVADLARTVPNVAHVVGRSVFENGGDYVTRIVHSTRRDHCVVAVCDGGIAPNLLENGDCPATAGRIAIVQRSSPPHGSSPPRKILVTGSSSHPRDVLGVIEHGAAEPVAGDLLVVSSCGAARGAFAAGPPTGRVSEYLA